MRADQQFGLDLLRSFGLSTEKVVRLTLTIDIDDAPTLDVTYLAWENAGVPETTTTLRFVREGEK